ncbi:hypothetical protein RhiXN_04788 [Rhizoctonia solani]|uniref:Uncharacterized protein n=1 Tax=Rhizoctonia solani TaxID=456999 RepID=A0A8H7H7N8_9AGAM|nr:uncharacterized protein RhiXN_04788 [Rhizoctonia solani]KAF8677434.1 hypothetical protein RHS04_06085 [Rhizoctonia solani]QRW16786.1 hypothetical protein RhiXN_04788 [Rhizoctonia solani]
MASRFNQLSPVPKSPGISVANQGRLCYCDECTPSFVSTVSTVSEVSAVPEVSTVSNISATHRPLEIDSWEGYEASEAVIPDTPQYLPPFRFSTDISLIELNARKHNNQASAEGSVGPDRRKPYSSRSRGSNSRTQPMSHIVFGVAARSPGVPRRKTNPKAATSVSVDNSNHKESTVLPPHPPPREVSARAKLQPVKRTNSDYNKTPLPAIPLGPPNRNRQ